MLLYFHIVTAFGLVCTKLYQQQRTHKNKKEILTKIKTMEMFETL